MIDCTHKMVACVIHGVQMTTVNWCSVHGDGDSNCQMMLSLQKYNLMHLYIWVFPPTSILPVTIHSDDKIESESVQAEHM